MRSSENGVRLLYLELVLYERLLQVVMDVVGGIRSPMLLAALTVDQCHRTLDELWRLDRSK